MRPPTWPPLWALAGAGSEQYEQAEYRRPGKERYGRARQWLILDPAPERRHALVCPICYILGEVAGQPAGTFPTSSDHCGSMSNRAAPAASVRDFLSAAYTLQVARGGEATGTASRSVTLGLQRCRIAASSSDRIGRQRRQTRPNLLHQGRRTRQLSPARAEHGPQLLYLFRTASISRTSQPLRASASSAR